jgi:small subunit ribosomal protein S20
LKVPHNKSCKKRLANSKKRNDRNRQNRSMMRAQIKVYRAEIEKAAPEEKIVSLTAMYSLIDTQARKGLMPKKRASRLKSRMAAAAVK